MFLHEAADILGEVTPQTLAREVRHGFIAYLDVQFLEFSNEKHPRQGVAPQALLRRFFIAGPLARAEKMVDARLAQGGIKIGVLHGLAIDRAVLAALAPPARAEIHIRRKENDERNND